MECEFTRVTEPTGERVSDLLALLKVKVPVCGCLFSIVNVNLWPAHTGVIHGLSQRFSGVGKRPSVGLDGFALQLVG